MNVSMLRVTTQFILPEKEVKFFLNLSNRKEDLKYKIKLRKSE